MLEFNALILGNKELWMLEVKLERAKIDSAQKVEGRLT
jgi:hypothetical protein